MFMVSYIWGRCYRQGTQFWPKLDFSSCNIQKNALLFYSTTQKSFFLLRYLLPSPNRSSFQKLTSGMADLISDGISENTLFSDVHGKDALDVELQRLHSNMWCVSAVPVRDVLFQLVGEFFRSTLRGHNRKLPDRVGCDHYRQITETADYSIYP